MIRIRGMIIALAVLVEAAAIIIAIPFATSGNGTALNEGALLTGIAIVLLIVSSMVEESSSKAKTDTSQE